MSDEDNEKSFTCYICGEESALCDDPVQLSNILICGTCNSFFYFRQYPRRRFRGTSDSFFYGDDARLLYCLFQKQLKRIEEAT